MNLKFLVFVTIICLISPNLSTSLNDGLSAYYPCTGNANDFSPNGNHGTVIGPIFTNDRVGTPNSACMFLKSHDYIDISNHISLNPTNQITISFWIKFLTTKRGWTVLVYKGGDYIGGCREREYTIWSYTDANPQEIYFHYASAGDKNVENTMDTKWINIKDWIFFAGVIDRANHITSIYINGTLNAQIVDSYSSFNNNNNNLRLGFGYGQGADCDTTFNGILDEVRIHKRALTESEINELYTECFTQVPLFTSSLILSSKALFLDNKILTFEISENSNKIDIGPCVIQKKLYIGNNIQKATKSLDFDLSSSNNIYKISIDLPTFLTYPCIKTEYSTFYGYNCLFSLAYSYSNRNYTVYELEFSTNILKNVETFIDTKIGPKIINWKIDCNVQPYCGGSYVVKGKFGIYQNDQCTTSKNMEALQVGDVIYVKIEASTLGYFLDPEEIILDENGIQTNFIMRNWASVITRGNGFTIIQIKLMLPTNKATIIIVSKLKLMRARTKILADNELKALHFYEIDAIKNADNTSGGLSVGWIAFIACGSVFLIVLIILIIICVRCLKMKLKLAKDKNPKKIEIKKKTDNARDGAKNSVNCKPEEKISLDENVINVEIPKEENNSR